VEQRERGASGSAVARQREKGREKGGGGPRRGGATRCGGAVGPGPNWRTAPDNGPSAAVASDVRRARVPAG
jgi:hypothetical protein